MDVESHDTPEALAELIRHEPRARIVRWLMAARLGRVAAEVVLSERQVYAWVARYNAAGADALADRPGRGRKEPLSADDEERLNDRLRAGPTEADGICVLRSEDVRRILRDEFGVERSLQATYDLLHRLGFEPLRPRPRHPKADAPLAGGLQKSFPERVAEAAAARPGEHVEVWFEDEARLGQEGSLTAVWAERGPARRRRSRRPMATCTS